MTDVDRLLDRVRAKVFSQFRNRTDVEDLCQEASVTAWRTWKEHPEWDEARLVHHGYLRALSHVTNPGHNALTGKPVNAAQHKSLPAGEVSRQKIKLYIDEYEKLHGETPNHSQVGRALGMSPKNVAHHRKRLHLFDDARTPADVKTYSLDAGLEADEPPAWTYSIPWVVVDYEAAASSHEVREAVSRLKDKDREFIYREFWLDQRPVDIAKALRTRDNHIPRMRSRILAQLREELSP